MLCTGIKKSKKSTKNKSFRKEEEKKLDNDLSLQIGKKCKYIWNMCKVKLIPCNVNFLSD